MSPITDKNCKLKKTINESRLFLLLRVNRKKRETDRNFWLFDIFGMFPFKEACIRDQAKKCFIVCKTKMFWFRHQRLGKGKFGQE